MSAQLAQELPSYGQKHMPIKAEVLIVCPKNLQKYTNSYISVHVNIQKCTSYFSYSAGNILPLFFQELLRVILQILMDNNVKFRP